MTPTPLFLPWEELVPQRFATPCFVVDEERLAANLDILDAVQKRTGAKILLALKGFAMFSTFALLRRVLHGVCASSVHEARLGREEFGREVHVFAAAYSDEDMRELVELADHIVFNSFAQWEHFSPLLEQVKSRGRALETGFRINPEHSEGAVPLYDPCAPGSRLGIRQGAFASRNVRSLRELGMSGLHFHTLCEQDAAPLARTLDEVERRFSHLFAGLRWLNFGGGHHITKPGYDLDLLCRCITRIRERYGLEIYLEPGEAVALNAGVLVSTVLDVVEADMPVVILDCSAAAHMPDVLEMPYRPEVAGAGTAGEQAWTCRLAGKSCLAGDVVGEYSFPAPLRPKDRVFFLDMAHYTMVKTTTFNGLGLPGIALRERGGQGLRMVRQFGYEDFKTRLS